MRAILKNQAGEVVARLRLSEDNADARVLISLQDEKFYRHADTIFERGVDVRVFVESPFADIPSLQELKELGDHYDAQQADQDVHVANRDLYPLVPASGEQG
jgi:hypothetical protein